MALPKSKKQKKKETPKIHPIDKSQNNAAESVPKAPNTVVLEKIFKQEEIDEVKKILNVTDLSTVPVIFCCVILGKLTTIKKLIKQGHDVNAKGIDNSTPLMWAVKRKNIEVMNYLMFRGASVYAVDDAGKNVFLLALDSNDWDELSFLNFWNKVKKSNVINLEFGNKYGNRILHYAVKRQWHNLVENLINDKVNINACNNKGVSALIMAAARNNFKLVELLLNAGAKVCHEDTRGYSSVCYLIASLVRKNQPKPYDTLNLLTKNFNSEQYEKYIQKHITLIIKPPNIDITLHISNLNKITSVIIQFFMKEVDFGIKILLKLHIFEKMKQALQNHIDNIEYVQTILTIICLILTCTSDLQEVENNVKEDEVNDAFINEGTADFCLTILKKYCETDHLKTLLINVFHPIIHSCRNNRKISRNWIRNNIEILECYLNQFLECYQDIVKNVDNEHSSFFNNIQEKLNMFNKIYNLLKNDLTFTSDASDEKSLIRKDSLMTTAKSSESFIVCKRKKIRRKTRKTKRRNSIAKEDVNKSSSSDTEKIKKKEETLVIKEIWAKPEGTCSSSSVALSTNTDELDEKVSLALNTDCNFTLDDNHGKNQSAEFRASIVLANVLLRKTIDNYRIMWEQELLTDPHKKKIKRNKHGKLKLSKTQKQQIKNIKHHFNEAVSCIEIMFIDGDYSYKKSICELTDILKNHSLPEVDDSDNDLNKINDESFNGKFGAIGDHLPQKQCNTTREFTSAEKLYIEEIQPLLEASSQSKNKESTNQISDQSYHLMESIIKICDEPTNFSSEEDVEFANIDNNCTMPQAANVNNEPLINHMNKPNQTASPLFSTQPYSEDSLNSTSPYFPRAYFLNNYLLSNPLLVNSMTRDNVAPNNPLLNNPSTAIAVFTHPLLITPLFFSVENYPLNGYTIPYNYLPPFMPYSNNSYNFDTTSEQLPNNNYPPFLNDFTSQYYNSSNTSALPNECLSSDNYSPLNQSYHVSSQPNRLDMKSTFSNDSSSKQSYVSKSVSDHSLPSTKQYTLRKVVSEHSLTNKSSLKSTVLQNIEEFLSQNQTPAHKPVINKSSLNKCNLPNQYLPQNESPNNEDENGNLYFSWESMANNLKKALLLPYPTTLIIDNWTLLSPNDLKSRITIPSGGRFCTGDLGFDCLGHPLAVKRIKYKNAVMYGQLLDCMGNLMKLKNLHLLRYILCDMHSSQQQHNEITLCIPLCKFTMEEYLHSKSKLKSKERLHLVMQMLKGMQYLHNLKTPIIHGNLKPTNIFIDVFECMRLSEYGIYRFLYLTTPAPVCAQVWFSQETYQTYLKKRKGLQCTLQSDIQVCGMLIHYIFTHGKHPFGDDNETILSHLNNGSINGDAVYPEVENFIIKMLVSNPHDRPNINEVITTVDGLIQATFHEE